MEIFKGLSGKFLVPYALVFVFGVWTYFSISNIVEYHYVQDALHIYQNKILEMRKIEKDFLAREFKNPDFLTSGQSKYLSEFNVRKNELDSIGDYLLDRGMFQQTTQDSLSLLLLNYSHRFHQLTDLVRKRGFKDWGIEGALRDRIHEVESDDTPYDRVFMLNLRRHEKDFFLRHDLKYLQKFEKGVFAFKAHLKNTIEDSEKLSELIAKLDDYSSYFKQVVHISEQIGLTEEDGKYGEVRDAVHSLAAFTHSLMVLTSDRVQKRVTANEIALIILYIVIIAIGCFILFIHIRKITQSINTIKNSALTLAEGSFPESAKVSSKDELGLAHKALNNLTEGLKTKTKFAEKIGKGELDAQISILSDHDILGLSLLKMRDNLKAVVEETNEVINRAGEQGDLEARIDLEGKKGAWMDITESINNLLYSVSTPLISLNRIINELAKGDVTQRYQQKAKGDIGQLTQNLNIAMDNMADVLSDILSSADTIDRSSEELLQATQEVNISSNEIEKAVEEMSSGAKHQVDKVDKTSILIEGISKSANEMGQKSETIHAAAKSSVSNGTKGAEMVTDVVHKMDEIAAYSDRTNQSIDVLINRAKDISSVLNVIADISSQTNLLALNASIEAAQAGEAGRGFAVVAEEIRKLANGTRKSAGEIEQLIESINRDTEKASGNVKSMQSTVASGVKVSKEATVIFKEIVSSTGQTLQLSEEILKATKGQNKAVEEVVKNVEGIVVIAEETATGTEQTATSSSQLSNGVETYTRKAKTLADIASTLKRGISQFKLKKEQPSNAESTFA